MSINIVSLKKSDKMMKWTTLIIAAIGLILSIINTLVMLQKDKVILKIVPLIYAQQDHHTCITANELDFSTLPSKYQIILRTNGKIAFTIINKSNFPIEIDDVGFSVNKRLDSNRLFIKQPFLINAPEHLQNRIDRYTLYPIKLGSRESITFLIPKINEEDMRLEGHRYIYAHTMCDKTFYANANTILEILRLK